MRLGKVRILLKNDDSVLKNDDFVVNNDVFYLERSRMRKLSGTIRRARVRFSTDLRPIP